MVWRTVSLFEPEIIHQGVAFMAFQSIIRAHRLAVAVGHCRMAGNRQPPVLEKIVVQFPYPSSFGDFSMTVAHHQLF